MSNAFADILPVLGEHGDGGKQGQQVINWPSGSQRPDGEPAHTRDSHGGKIGIRQLILLLHTHIYLNL
jgi:hypothetical protein